ncbi:MAG: hypothetical protein JXN64_12535 [Spirochaetes bacterium]|nr:hypothetical protein [Spirochaetota bacterium]
MRKLFLIISVCFFSSSIFSQGNIDGFGNFKWGSSINDVKVNVVGKLSYTDDKKLIISRDGDIEYLYGFFYKSIESGELEPASVTPAKDEKPETNSGEPTGKKDESGIESKDSKLFYVSIRFPYLSKDEVKRKIEEKYGPSTGEDVKDNRGAIVWNSGSTTIIMWVDSYLKKSYCMKINYLSKDISKEVKDYLNIIFNNREIEVLKKLSL